MLWARCHHFQMVDSGEIKSCRTIQQCRVFVRFQSCVSPTKRRLFSHLRILDVTFDCPVEHCLLRQHAVNLLADSSEIWETASFGAGVAVVHNHCYLQLLWIC